MQRHWFRGCVDLGGMSCPPGRAQRLLGNQDSRVGVTRKSRFCSSNPPWAKEGFARMELERNGAQAQATEQRRKGGDMPDLRPGAPAGGQRGVPIGEEVPPVPNPDSGPPVQFRVLARWETAKPVRLAGRPEVPEVTGQFYVIRLRGLPLMRAEGRAGEVAPNPNEACCRQSRTAAGWSARISPHSLFPSLQGSGDNSNEVLLFFPRREDDSDHGSG